MAIGETIECAMYVLRPSDENGRMAQESERVESLPMEKIVAHTGDPQDLREQTIYCTLDPGYYTILCAAYKDGEEGPFTIKVHSNYEVTMSQIWPPLWKKKGLAGPEKTLKEKLLEKTGSLRASSHSLYPCRWQEFMYNSKIEYTHIYLAFILPSHT